MDVFDVPELRVLLEVSTGTSRSWAEAAHLRLRKVLYGPRQATSPEAVRPRRANSLMIRNCWYLA
jgi:hypothetical protein